MDITLNNIKIEDVINAKYPPTHKVYRILEPSHYGYIIRNYNANNLEIKNNEFIINNATEFENLVCVYNDEPLYYVDEPKATFYLGTNKININTIIYVLDNDPNKRRLSKTPISLSGKSLTGEITKIEITASYTSNPISRICAQIRYTGHIDDTEYYYHARKLEYGTLSKIEDSIFFSKEESEEFCDYRSGCGHAEHYILPGSSFVKYVVVKAEIKGINQPIEISYNVSDDPKYMHEQMIKSLSRHLYIHTDTVSYADSDGHYEETISDITIKLEENKNGECELYVYYIPNEYKNRHKAAEYSSTDELVSFCKNMIDNHNITAESLYAIDNTAREISMDALRNNIKTNQNQMVEFNELHLIPSTN